MAVAILDTNARVALQTLRHNAEKSPYTMDDLLDIKAGRMKIPGDEEQFRCEIPFELKVVFTHEQQPVGLVRHLSVSHRKNYPNIALVRLIMNELGFQGDLESCLVTNDAHPGVVAINVLEVAH